MDRTKKIIIIISTVVAVILLAVVFVLVAKGNKKALENQNKTIEQEKIKEVEKEEKEEDEEEKEEPQEKEPEEDPEEQIKTAEIRYDLKSQTEEFVVDNDFKIKFVGTKEDYGTDMYTYNADLYYKGKLIKTQLFNVIDNRVIYSSNHNSEFYVEKIENVYVIVSRIVKQNDGTYAVIMNTNGEVLREFNDVALTIKGNYVMVSLNTSGDENIYTTFEIKDTKFELRPEE